MRHLRTLTLLVAAAGSIGTAVAQNWIDSYDSALAALRRADWAGARQAFQAAKTDRPVDQAQPTALPGPVTDPRRWRGGSPYSANFGAAYAAFKHSQVERDEEARTALLAAAGAELEALIALGQTAPETFFILGQVFAAQRDTQKQRDLDARVSALEGRFNWRVDGAILTPEDSATLATLMGTRPRDPGRAERVQPPVVQVPGAAAATVTGAVATLPYKYAIVIGNSEGRLTEGKVPFAATDAALMKDALVQHAGYPAENVTIVTNATGEQMRAAVQALATRMTEGGTVAIYFSGQGVNLNGKDYLVGVDADDAWANRGMLAKADVYRAFMQKGARIFAFFQVHRPVIGGNFFGQEIPIVGAISQMQATSPGDEVLGFMSGGRLVGVFTHSMANVLIQLRSNRVPVTEFAWQVFYDIRRGGTGATGGSSRQTPTLPVLTNMATDARF